MTPNHGHWRAAVTVLSFGLLPYAALGGVISGQLIGGTTDGVLYDVNPATGLATNPRDTGIDDLRGLGFAPDGTLYASASPSGLFRVDPATGDAEQLSSMRFAFSDFEIDPVSGLLFAASAGPPGGGHPLYSVDLFSSLQRGIGTIELLNASIAIDGQGRVFGVGASARTGLPSAILHVDRNTAVALETWQFDFALGKTGSAFGGDGLLFVVDGGLNNTGYLRSFNPDSGLFEVIGHTGVSGGLSSLAYIPEPATIVLLSVSILVFLGSRFRWWRAQPATGLILVFLIQSMGVAFGSQSASNFGRGTHGNAAQPNSDAYLIGATSDGILYDIDPTDSSPLLVSCNRNRAHFLQP